MRIVTSVRRALRALFSPKLATFSYSALAAVLVGALFGTASLTSVGTASATQAAAISVSETGAAEGPHSGDDSYLPPSVVGTPNPVQTADPVKESLSLVTVSQATAEKIAAERGLPILSSSAGAAVMAVPNSQLADVQKVAPEASVESNQRMSIATDQLNVPSWGLDRIDTAAYALDSKYSYDTTGVGVRIYVVDTGINTTHVDFTGRIVSGYSPLTDGYGFTDCNGHGTHVAGTAAGTTYGVAKAATITPVRILNCAGSGYVSDIITGLNWIMATHPGGPAVINMSVGGGYSAALNSAIASATTAGFTVVVAAGNSNADACNSSPSSAPSAITVGATGTNDAWASFSNGGSCVDISAPGVNIVSDYIGSSTAKATMSGTSMASPHVTGAAARVLSANPALTPAGVIASLTASSTKNLITGIYPGTVNNLMTLVATTASPSPTPTRTSLAALLTLSTSSTTRSSTVATWTTAPTEVYDSFTLVVRNQGTGKTVATYKLAGTARSYTVGGLSRLTQYQISLTGSALAGTTTLTTPALTATFRTL